MTSTVVMSAWIGATPVTEWDRASQPEMRAHLRLPDDVVTRDMNGTLDTRYAVQVAQTFDGTEIWSAGVRWVFRDDEPYLSTTEALKPENLPSDLGDEIWLRVADENDQVVALTWVKIAN